MTNRPRLLRLPRGNDPHRARRRPRRTRRPLRGDDRGSALAFAALVFLGVLGILALAIDLGMLFETRGQAQRTADAAALAGAAALVDFGNSTDVIDRVHEYTMGFVDTNPVRGVTASVEPTDIVVDLDAWRVTVTVHRTAARGNAVPTVFGRIVGRDEVDVAAIATAEAAPALGVNCLLPLAMPDRWNDINDNGLFEAPPEHYVPWGAAGATGYGSPDIGTEIVIKPFKSTEQMNSSWYFPWRPPGQSGGDDYRDNIAGCVDPSVVIQTGDVVDTEPGAMIGPTKQGFGDLIAQDPNAYWRAGDKCVGRTGVDGCVGFSARVRPMPMFDPSVPPDPGSKPFTITNFMNVFVDRIQGNEVYARFLGVSGVVPGGGGAGTTGPAVRYVRLIQ